MSESPRIQRSVLAHSGAGQARHTPQDIRPILALLGSMLLVSNLLAEPARSEYLSDRSDLILSSSQGWGTLGLDTAAYAPGQQPLPLRLGE